VNFSLAVAVAPDNVAPIAAAIAGRTAANGGTSSSGNTPTRAAENAAVSYLSSLTDMEPRFILLATDGLPTCPPRANMTLDDSPGAVQAVADARAEGIGTFVIGIGALPTADDTLSRMAMAGGYPRAASATAYYPVSSTDDLIAALNEVVN